MALHKDYTGREHEVPARWHPFKRDPDTGKMAEVLVRPMPRALAVKIREKYEQPVEREVRGRTETRLEVPDDSLVPMLLDGIYWTWIDVREFIVGVHSQQTAQFFRDALYGDTVAEGDDLQLDGKLNDKIKKWCLDEIPGLMDWFSEYMRRRSKHASVGDGRDPEEAREAALLGNSSTGSASPSSTENERREPDVAPDAASSVEPATPVSRTSG